MHYYCHEFHREQHMAEFTAAAYICSSISTSLSLWGILYMAHVMSMFCFHDHHLVREEKQMFVQNFNLPLLSSSLLLILLLPLSLLSLSGITWVKETQRQMTEMRWIFPSSSFSYLFYEQYILHIWHIIYTGHFSTGMEPPTFILAKYNTWEDS